MRATRRKPELVLRNGKPTAVILGIRDYEAILERLDDAEDLRWLREVRKKPLRYRKLEEVIAEIERV
jgi:PHD/YefM family antitoxin component YafN of YafNO toxin-antitoxin module